MEINGIEIEEIKGVKVLVVKPGEKITISRGDGYLILATVGGHGILKEAKYPESNGYILSYGHSALQMDRRRGDEYIIENKVYEGQEPKELRIIVFEMKWIKR